MMRRLGVLAGVLLLAACGGGGDRLKRFDMKDLQVPAMFTRLAAGRDRAYVLELPPTPVDKRFDVVLEGVTEDQILDEIVKRDPAFQHARIDDVLVMWPTGKDDAGSPFSKTIDSFDAEAGAGDVVNALMRAAKNPSEVRADKIVGRRPVVIHARGMTLRDVLADVARQAHAGIVAEPGQVTVGRVSPQPTGSP